MKELYALYEEGLKADCISYFYIHHDTLLDFISNTLSSSLNWIKQGPPKA